MLRDEILPLRFFDKFIRRKNYDYTSFAHFCSPIMKGGIDMIKWIKGFVTGGLLVWNILLTLIFTDVLTGNGSKKKKYAYRDYFSERER